jgi:2'-5' RNA ligase
MGNESALIIPVPEVEPIVEPVRWQYDAMARLGIPAHITLLYPFYPGQEVGNEIESLRRVCASIVAFSFSFTEVRRFPATAYLHPDQSERFAQITRTLTKMWPDRKPYGGAFAEIIPHLTVADRVDSETLSAVVNSLHHQLPIRCLAKEVWLLTSNDAGIWSRRGCFPLAEPGSLSGQVS